MELRRWQPQINTDPWLEDDCSDVEAKLAIAVEALEVYADGLNWSVKFSRLFNGNPDEYYGNALAQNALAKIRGENER